MFTMNKMVWDVEIVPSHHPILKRPDGIFTFGCCDGNAKTIYISGDIYGDFLRKVLAHEITHAAMFSYEVELTFEQEELVADLIATFGAEIIEMTNALFQQLQGRY